MLRDLAQRRAFEVRVGGDVVAVAFAPNVAGASLLVELLTLPDTHYEVVQRENVALLHRSAGTGLAVVSSCLRG
jgi:hypothetical protein